MRISGVYWGLTALHILQRPDALPRDELLDFVFSCMHDNGAFGAGPGHDFHLTFTLNAVQILALLDGFDEYEKRLPGAKAKTGQCKMSTTSLGSVLINLYSHRISAATGACIVRRRRMGRD